MKKKEQRSEARDFFEMTRTDFFTETASTPSEWLRELRKDLDLTLSQLGELVGVNRIQVWKWETGRVNPPKSALICTLFLRIIRTVAEQDLSLATYPISYRTKMLATNKKLLKMKDKLIQTQTEEVCRRADRMMIEQS